MKVQSPLADMDIRIGAVRRAGNDLLLQSDAASSLQATIRVSAREAVGILGRILGSAGGLAFVLGLPYFWLRQRLGGASDAPAVAAPRVDINKPW